MNSSNIINLTLKHIRIVLIHTSHPGNIGSTARAMKTMGLTDLYLVSPKTFPDDQATAMSSNAKDILEAATVVDKLQDALADCQLVIGSSARDKRSLTWEILTAQDCGERVVKHAHLKNQVALVFGRESSGLTNDELALCQYLVNVPTNPEYSSLNVASAVQILSYECRLAALGQSSDTDNETEQSGGNTDELAEESITAGDVEAYLEQLEIAMIDSKFLDPKNPKHLMTRLRRLYGRTRMTRSEINILRGMLVSFQKRE